MIWVVFEGVDGSGKTTLLDTLADRLCCTGDLKVITCREPGDPVLRPMAIQEHDVMTRQLLMAADARRNYVANVEPYLDDQDAVVLQDRGAWSASVYSGLDDPLVESLGHGGRKPDLYVYVDAPTKTLLQRRSQRPSLDQFDDAGRRTIEARKAAYEALIASEVTARVERARGDTDPDKQAAYLETLVVGMLDGD